MHLTRMLAAQLILALCLLSNALAAEEAKSSAFSIKENILMFYYKDISTVVPFYEETLGLRKTFNNDWAKIYQLTPTSFVGVIQEGETSFHDAKPDNSVMLSIVTEQVDQWYAHLKSDPNITFIKEIYNSKNTPVRAFLIQDPGGYSVEFFQWIATNK